METSDADAELYGKCRELGFCDGGGFLELWSRAGLTSQASQWTIAARTTLP
jgi:hypothetical protein